jgi:putative flippase GtrA
MSVLVSLGGVVLGSFIIDLLVKKIALFEEYKIAAKLVATGLIFFYNFYLKRFAFEKRLPGQRKEEEHEA